MTQDPIRLADVIERVEKLEEEDHCSPSRVFESIKETRNRIEALEKLQDEIHGATMKFLGQIEEKNAEWLLKFVALQKQVDDQLDGRQQVNKAYGEMFANLQKQITLLQSRK